MHSDTVCMAKARRDAANSLFAPSRGRSRISWLPGHERGGGW
jgi:hypothetical protein